MCPYFNSGVAVRRGKVYFDLHVIKAIMSSL